MTFRQLTAELPRPMSSGNLDANIKGLAYDSRYVKPGYAFIALRGAKVDGHDFIEKAIEAGAAAIIAETPPPADSAMPWLHVADTRQTLALLAATIDKHPAKSLDIAGITGTNGKTTIAFLIHYLMNKAVKRCGLLGTIYYDLGGPREHATHTTPESMELSRYLSKIRDNGCRAVAMEVSSHALAQHRVYGIPFKAGVFTNLTQDHLDFHGTMEKYFEAKCLLFESIAAQKNGKMIINADDPWGRKLIQRFEGTGRIVRYGFGVGLDLQATGVRYDLTGTSFELNAKGRHLLVRTPLIGDFNVYNCLAALAAADALGANFREAVGHLKSAPQVPGRLERVSDEASKFHIYVDYAHTPDALVNVLRTLRALRPERIITVFGCGGDRDRLKRPLMARAAEAGSDICILTSDNPRTEDPEKIAADTRKGFSRKSYAEILDRAEAIRTAVNNASPGDIVLIAGKGHEDYQEINGVKQYFDDRRVARGAMFNRRDQAVQKREERMREAEAREWERREQEFKAPRPQNDEERPGERRWNQ